MPSQSDDRFYHLLVSSAGWLFDFKLFKHGDDIPLVSSTLSYNLTRTTMLCVELALGKYVVYVRLDLQIDKEQVSASPNGAPPM